MPEPIQCSSDSSPFFERSSRRTATVTISDPDAWWAAFMVWKSLYFPVPTSSRDVKVCVPSLKGLSGWFCVTSSSSTDEGHDLELVALGQPFFGACRAGHDAFVAFHRHPRP